MVAPLAGEDRLRVLLVDDDHDIHQAITEVLEDEAIEVEIEHAYDGADALAKMKARAPHLLILDVRMPVMDGLALREAMLQDEALVDVYVAVFTANSLSATELQVLMGDDYIPKPVDLERLVKVIEKAQARVEASEGRQLSRYERAIARVETLQGDIVELLDKLRSRARRMKEKKKP